MRGKITAQPQWSQPSRHRSERRSGRPVACRGQLDQRTSWQWTLPGLTTRLFPSPIDLPVWQLCDVLLCALGQRCCWTSGCCSLWRVSVTPTWGFGANWGGGVSSHAETKGRVVGTAHKCSSNQYAPIWRLTWKENNVPLFAQTRFRCFHVLYCMPNWSDAPKRYPKVSPLPIPQAKQSILLSRQQTRRLAP